MITGYTKPITQEFSGDKQIALEKLKSGALLCSFDNDIYRRWVFEFKTDQNYPIETLECDCGNYERKHKAYYYEWALEYRTLKGVK